MTVRRIVAGAASALVVGSALLVAQAAPAQAAAGVIGRIDTVSLTGNAYSCFPEDPCTPGAWSDVRITGWALNTRTAPAQDVRFVFSGTVRRYQDGSHAALTWVSKSYISNRSRPDVQRHYGLNSPNVGYSLSFQTSHAGFYIGSVSVCESARDHGTSQAWRTVNCRTVTAH